ncbi:hypothetical protein CEP52_005656 [Fusarium oligoseptatum]|uniref:Uncharacterized protein n=1 Tax=Fusarium oligoseptatum TaxID=2604345 RepID=A0A428TX23_9HYPO|nr:hypothetical protein CEP52_005656 [Fusarium oligoseptatum]
MAFEPISGTIGAVAFADQMFARCVWVYKKYKLSQDFGSDYVEYQTKYHCEIFRFDQIISHPHSGLAESALDTGQRHLREPLRSRLQIWMADLDKCGKLVAKYEEKLEPNSDGAEDDAVEEGACHKIFLLEPNSPDFKQHLLRLPVRLEFLLRLFLLQHTLQL